MNFGELITAMVTPFDENGRIDFAATGTMMEHLRKTGTDSIVIAGTTGESPTLTTSEKIDLIRYAVDVAAKRFPVIAGTGTNNTLESIELTRQAELAGADAIMLVVPYYNKPCQEGIISHFTAIADATALPIMLYNIPGRSTVSMEIDTVVRLSQISNITAIKEASGDLEIMATLIDRLPEGFSIYCGDDSLTLPSLAIGGTGVVSVAAHVIGSEMSTMISNFKNGHFEEAAILHRRLLPIMKGLFMAPNPAPVKAALHFQGLPSGGVRLPLLPLANEQLETLHDLLKEQSLVVAES